MKEKFTPAIIALLVLVFSFSCYSQAKHPSKKKKTQHSHRKNNHNKKAVRLVDSSWKKDADLPRWEPV